MSKLNDKPIRAQSNAAPYSLINEQLPLNAVRAFTEAAKHCNFSKAAASLGMTQSGVSRHVANLEQWTQKQLFIRNGGQLTLTDAGRLYHESIREAMATIDLVSRQLKTQGAKTRLPTLAVRTSLPTFSMSVLIPALSTFQAEHQTNIEVLTALSPLEPMDKCDVLITRDLIIQDAEQWHLFSEDLICVGSAKILSECKVALSCSQVTPGPPHTLVQCTRHRCHRNKDCKWLRPPIPGDISRSKWSGCTCRT